MFKEGLPPVIFGLLLSAGCFYAGRTEVLPLLYAPGGLFLLFAGFCVFFFRNPPVKITEAPEGKKIVLSPCNGTVLEIDDSGADENVVRVFMSLFDVHCQRSPVDAVVTSVVHQDGKYLAADNPRAWQENEQNIITMKNDDGVFIVKQIAGLVARRCVAWVKPGDAPKQGGLIGLIRFGSQVDLHIPKSFAILVHPGDKVRAGVTIDGEL
jgi:phosphatidylserine decarboxylase